jgi:hypothetical protein
MIKKIVRTKKMKSPKRIESVPHRLSGLRPPTNGTGSAGSNRGPAITEIEHPRLPGRPRLDGSTGPQPPKSTHLTFMVEVV